MIENYLPHPNPYTIESDTTYYITGERYPTYHVHGKRAYLTIEFHSGAPYEITGRTYNGNSRTFATMREALAWLRKQERGHG